MSFRNCKHRGLLGLAKWMMGKGYTKRAFRILSWLKGNRCQLAGVDLLRARCRLTKNATGEAIEMLKEELRWHPENQEARALLESLRPEPIWLEPEGKTRASGEFSRLFEAVREYTMLSPDRLCFLYEQARKVIATGIPGHFVECGVAAGGSSALLAAVLKRNDTTGKSLFSFDTFEGMPAPGPEDIHCGMEAQKTGWGTGTCSAPLDSLRDAATLLGCWDRIVPVQGLFGKTLPQEKSKIGRIALLHMDGDWYSSTKDILENLYDLLSPGAYVQVDDYGHWDGCKKALDEFFDQLGWKPQLIRVDSVGVGFWKKN